MNPKHFVPSAEAAYLAGVGTRDINRLVDESIVPESLVARAVTGRRYARLAAALANFYYETESVFQPRFRKEVIQLFVERVEVARNKDRLYALESPEKWNIDCHVKTNWIDLDVGPFIHTVAARAKEIEQAERMVECNPAIMNGFPVLKGSRLLAEVVAATAELENGMERLKDAHPAITEDHVRAAQIYIQLHQRRGRPPRLRDANPDWLPEARPRPRAR